MMDTKHSPHAGFDIAKQLSMAVAFIGGILMLNWLGGEIREASASDWSLFLGAGCFVLGLILTLLFMILIRLDRVEQQNAGSGREQRSA